MGGAVKCGGRRGAGVGVLNVILLAALLAVLALGATVLTARPATADHGYTVTNATIISDFDAATNTYRKKQIFWYGRPTCCGDIVDAGVNSWDARGYVDWINGPTNIAGTNQTHTLKFQEGTSGTLSELGRYSFALYTEDTITFYTNNFRRMTQADRNWLGRHETGHALALRHRYEISFGVTGNVVNEATLESAANQRCCVMHTYHNRQDSNNTYKGITTLTTHDVEHHRARWENR